MKWTPFLLLAALVVMELAGLPRWWSRRDEELGWNRPAKVREASVWAVVAWMILPALAFVCVGAIGHGIWPAVFGLVAIVVLLFPWALVRTIAIPLGWVRVSYVLTLLSDVMWRGDRRGGAVVAGTWAWMRGHAGEERMLLWLEDRLTGEAGRERDPLRAASVVARGMLKLAHGDEETARRLFESAEWLETGTRGCWMARRCARELLMAGAAAQGDWARVSALRRAPGANWFTSWFLGRAADRLLGGAESVSDLALWWLWALAPSRRNTRYVLRLALATPPEGRMHVTSESPHVPTGGGPMHTALRLHVRTLQLPVGRVSAVRLRALSAAWDTALDDPTVRRHAMVRAAAVGATDIGGALEAMRAVVLNDLVNMARRGSVAVSELGDGELALRVGRALRDEMLDTLEGAAETLFQRATDKRALPPVDEWTDVVGVRRLYEETMRLGDDAVRRLAFSCVHARLCRFAVWQFNERRERVMAHALFRWLLDEAEAVGDDQAIELQRSNVKVGI